MTSYSGHFIAAHLKDMESKKSTLSPPKSAMAKQSLHISNPVKHIQLGSSSSSMSLNGCEGDPRAPLGTTETRTFSTAATLALAADRLNSALFDLKTNTPPFDSGIIRIQVPIDQQILGLDWLRSQTHSSLLSRSYFSGRESAPLIHDDDDKHKNNNSRLVSVSGLGSAVYFSHFRPFSSHHWQNIQRFLSKKCPLIRAYGAIRFDSRSTVASEWNQFGSFYFMVPQVEFVEFEGSSMIAATIAWDNGLLRTYDEAIAALETTMWQVSSVVRRQHTHTPPAVLLHQLHVPSKSSWDSAVKRALDLITRENSTLSKVVLARSSRVLTTVEIDPLEWLSCLKTEGDSAYQFCLQPPESPAFVGNTPERLFHRKRLSVCSEALAATRARGETEYLDFQIGQDLLTSSKDHHEFTIVRESIRRKLETICSNTLIEPYKTLRKLPRVQHLYARLKGTLEREDDEDELRSNFLRETGCQFPTEGQVPQLIKFKFKILSSLHPTPAVCGHPTEEARVLISETETFDRGMYAGPVGWFGGTESEFAVGIRSALVGKGAGALLFAGTGIVEGSNSALEWQELELKTSQFTKLMKREAPPVSSMSHRMELLQIKDY